MATSNNYRARQNHSDIYEQITDYIIEALENGEIIWQKPWHTHGLPRNVTGDIPYHGWNAFHLNFVCLLKQYATPYFITFLQAKALGGTIRKGERGHQIIYMANVQSKYKSQTVIDPETGIEKEIPQTIRVPKLHAVFNISQTEGIEFNIPAPTQRTNIQKIEACEKIIEGMPQRPPITHQGERACYMPSIDEVFMPDQALFHKDESYYSVLFHELTHSTGHRSRLNRKELVDYDGFGGKNYSKEELTAELSAAYLCGIAGIERQTIDNSAAYIQGWLRKLKDDKKFFLNAASQARAASEFILNKVEATANAVSQYHFLAK